MAAIEGFGSVAASTLAVSADGGIIDGVNKPVVAATAVVATTGGKFKGFLVSEDGDGTYTITHTADDAAATAAAALVLAAALAVPSGGIGLFAGSVGSANAENPFDLSVRGKLPAVTS